MTRFLKVAALSIVLLAAQAGAMGTGEKESGPKAPPQIEAYNKGVKSMKKGDYAKAQQKFEKALAIQEDFPEAHNNLAYCLRKQGKQNFELSLKHYNRALELKPDLAQAYMYRGALYVLNGEPDKAKADLETLQKLDPEMAQELARVIESGHEKDGKDIYGMSKPLE